ncbi:protein DpdH [Vibrio breoganii]|uniref:protein DpdH n=1 Tax=Vibrio breoganii TaxID=553239 RepID=UPI0021C2AC77|nr:protein DpdH [Vibrio breoganii]MDN3716548.1 protein DpdH [Vibrio breoganii]
MSIQAYWPSLENIENCILSEAERLSDKLLLSVHHPMKLVAIPYSTNEPVVKSQQDLLGHLLSNHNIIPLIGESGSGKSHLIRWLHAVANHHPKAKKEQWHIIRIPKNASLSQVLEIILRGLEGDIFDNAREQIGKVANSLDHETTTNLMFAHVVEAFREVPTRLQKQHQALQSEGKMTKDKADEFMAEMSFAGELQHFFDDPHIKASFSGKDSAVRSRVSRLIEIRSYAELLEDNFQVVAEDFKFASGEEISTQLGARARRAYANLQLESDAAKRQMAADMTNKAIERACKLMFNRLFQFSTGNFQDLFKEIRKYLLKQNRTLVVLVEDLAAISSIDDVLIESLLEQDKDDGVQVLCPMKSVIATTDDLNSYQSHRNTIWTRTSLEWHLPTDAYVDNFPELKFSTEDVVDFCARYINAARHGIQDIETLIDVKDTETGLSTWNIELEEWEQETLDDFGYSNVSSSSGSSGKTGIPLFPYNKQAIAKLTQKHVFSGNHTRFNPRVVIQEVLLAILRDHRVSYSKNAYPSDWFEGQLSEFRNDDTALLIAHKIDDQKKARRLIGFMSLYSDAETSADCFKQVSKRQALAFGLETSLLPKEISLKATGRVIVADGPVRPTPNPPGGPNPQPPSVPKGKPDDPNSPSEEVVTWVNKWFSGESVLGQIPSNILRLALYQMLEQQKGFTEYPLNSNNVWGKGKESLIQATLKQNKLTLIELPGSRTNPERCKVKAFADKELSNTMDSLVLKKQMTAILRFATLNKIDKNDKNIVRVGWSYAQGLEDYALYMQFAQKWVPIAMARCVELAKQTAHNPLSEHVALAVSMGFDVSGIDKSLNQLVKTSTQIKSELPSAINPQHKAVFDKWLLDWDELRTRWLKTMLIGTNNAVHPITFSSAFRKRDKVVRSTRELEPVIREVKNTSASLKEYLEGSETKEELLELLELLTNTYKNIPAEMRPDYDVSINTVRSRIKQLSEIVTSHTPKSVIALNQTQDDPIKLLNKISGDELELWVKVLNDWKEISPKVNKNIREFNDKNGVNQIETYKKVINNRLLSVEESIQKLGAAHES